MSGKTINDVTLFSNGIGHFRRTYHVPGGKEETITIPFKTDYIGDVAASLQVFGKVRLSAPPSFTPANSNATSLQIDQQNALLSLLTQLSGASITIRSNSATIDSVLLGVEKAREATTAGAIEKNHIIYQTEEGEIARIAVDYIRSVQFNDESVRTEIEKALKMNFQRIKPYSTLLDLTLTAEQATDAVVQYTIPVAAWKMRYAIREDKGKLTLEGAAIIDNNTDEDWDDFRISVVTGNPISFNTDIAEVVLPERKMVRLVEGSALGNVGVEEGTVVQPCSARSLRSAGARSLGAKMSVQNYAQFGLESMSEGELADMESTDYVAEAPGVDSKEVGDFCVFTSKEPITILARKSAVVPMFTVALQHAGVVLYYKEINHSRRPYRAIKFKNETEYSLGRGKTVIYNEGVFSGECVLETAKPGENRMLPHCLENGVKVVKVDKGYTESRSSVRISDGVVADEKVGIHETVYELQNYKEEPFKFALEHVNRLPFKAMVDFSGIEIREQEKISDGWRVYFELPAKEKATLSVVETDHYSQSITLRDNFVWVMQAGVDSILSDPQVQACVKIQEEIDDLKQQLAQLTKRRNELVAQAERVRSNLEAVGQRASVDAWVDDLDKTEKEIRTIDSETSPDIKAKATALRKELTAKLKIINVNWRAER